jgi:thiol-disulfide isomerase/thioredoxin
MDKKKKDRLTWIAYIAIFLLFWVTGWHKPLISKLQQGILATGLIQADIDQEHSENAVDAILYDEEDQKIRLSEFRNGVVFFNVWATWCPPCKAEMPGIQSLYESAEIEGVNFVMISTDRNFEDAKKYKKAHNYTFPIYRLGESMSEELNSTTLPTTYIIGKKGNVEMVHKGMAQYNTEKFKDYLQQLVLKD